MRKLTSNELKRNRLYDAIANANFKDYEVIGHVKQGLLIRDKENDTDVVIKTIIKKSKVDYTKGLVERPTEQPEDKKEESK
jgi:hypothetical protein